jgi:hypothetical protein
MNDDKSTSQGASHTNGNGLGGPSRDWQLDLVRHTEEHWWWRV